MTRILVDFGRSVAENMFQPLLLFFVIGYRVRRG
jgi:hypothetical protein